MYMYICIYLYIYMCVYLSTHLSMYFHSCIVLLHCIIVSHARYKGNNQKQNRQFGSHRVHSHGSKPVILTTDFLSICCLSFPLYLLAFTTSPKPFISTVSSFRATVPSLFLLKAYLNSTGFTA